MKKILAEPQPWVKHALCLELIERGEATPDMWFPKRGEDCEAPKAVCAGCPVRQQCLDYALRAYERYGIWGGTSERERRELRARRRGLRPKQSA